MWLLLCFSGHVARQSLLQKFTSKTGANPLEWLEQTHLCTWCESPAVAPGSSWSSRSWGPAGGPPGPGSAAPARLSSPGKRPRPGRGSAPCSSSAACSRLWSWRTPRSRCDAAAPALQTPPAAPEPGPGSAERPAGTSPFVRRNFHSRRKKPPVCWTDCTSESPRGPSPGMLQEGDHGPTGAGVSRAGKAAAWRCALCGQLQPAVKEY